MRNTRIFVAGVLFGVVIATSTTALASDSLKSLVGKSVDSQASVTVNGKTIPEPAIIIEGTSYTPTRYVGEYLGMEVTWKEGSILLDSLSAGQKSLDLVNQSLEVNKKIKAITEELAAISDKIALYENYQPHERKISAEEHAALRKEYDAKYAESEKLTAELNRLTAEMNALNGKSGN